MSFQENGISNAANVFLIEQRGHDYWIDSIPELNIRFVDYGQEWKGFEALKEKLLPTTGDTL